MKMKLHARICHGSRQLASQLTIGYKGCKRLTCGTQTMGDWCSRAAAAAHLGTIWWRRAVINDQEGRHLGLQQSR